ncbi:YvrJ family protein [Aerococcus agrisoli]|nr:YvrJ family protein [Aerococcus agrisoli]
MDTMDVWMQLIGNVGFPIFVSVYLMTRTEKKIDDLIAAVEKLAQ